MGAPPPGPKVPASTQLMTFPDRISAPSRAGALRSGLWAGRGASNLMAQFPRDATTGGTRSITESVVIAADEAGRL